MTKLYELPLAGPISAGDWLLVSQSGHSRKVSALAVAGPQGEQGPQGPVGATGPQGEPADPAESIHAAASKTTPADADELGITDSAASWGLKKLTFANLKAWIGGLFVSKSGDTMTGALTATGLLSNSGGIGYTTGAGGTVTQETNKRTDVTLNKLVGVIVTHPSPLASGETAEFVVNNTLMAQYDLVVLNNLSVGRKYTLDITYSQNGRFDIAITNVTDTTLLEPVLIKFSIFKGEVT